MDIAIQPRHQTKLAQRVYAWGNDRKLGTPMMRFAEASGVHYSKVSLYMNGHPIPARHMLPICEELQCDPDDVAGWTE